MNHVIVIAEAGVNHNGSIEIAKQLIDVAKDAGADYIKFQTFKTENLVSKYAKKADYQIQTINNDLQFDMLKKLELTYEQHFEIINYCKEKEINFLTTAFDIESILFLRSLNLSLWKVPSGEITNYPYLKKISEVGEFIILSTGMCEMSDIAEAINVFVDNGINKNNITVLHCNTEYPSPMEDVNLKAMQTIASTFNVNIGYSDHTLGIEVPVAAVALGATIIEKHFTLDRNMEGPDHKASLEPNELKAMVSAIRNIEKALGNGEKHISFSENKNIYIVRKSIVAAIDIFKGEVFNENNIITKRPGNGISPMEWDNVIGKRAKRDFLMDELIEL